MEVFAAGMAFPGKHQASIAISAYVTVPHPRHHLSGDQAQLIIGDGDSHYRLSSFVKH